MQNCQKPRGTPLSLHKSLKINNWKIQHLSKSKTKGNPEDKRIKGKSGKHLQYSGKGVQKVGFYFFFVNELQVQYMQNLWLNMLSQTGLPPLGHATYPTHSFNKGMDVLLLLFCTMLAWFLKEIRMSEGANRHGSPSTCMGIDLYVKSVTSRHWCNLSPWPPTCRAAWRGGKKTTTTTTPQNR